MRSRSSTCRSSRCICRRSRSARSGVATPSSRRSWRIESAAKAPPATVRRSSSSPRAHDEDRAAARTTRRAPARHEPGQRPVPHGVRRLERGAARRSRRRRDALHRLPLYRGCTTGVGVDAEQTQRALLVDLAQRLDGRLGFEADVLPFSQVEALRSGGLELVPTSGIVEALRAVKDEDEIGAIGRAVRAAERAFEALTAETWVGRTERDLSWRLHQLMHANGADRPAFEVIATGANGSKPHAEPGEAIVGERTLVVADFGAQVDGYYSDCTRTLATGKNLPKDLRRAYDVCLEAQLAACAGIRPGMTGADADALARRIIAGAGFGDDFGHGLGHGIGI